MTLFSVYFLSAWSKTQYFIFFCMKGQNSEKHSFGFSFFVENRLIAQRACYSWEYMRDVSSLGHVSFVVGYFPYFFPCDCSFLTAWGVFCWKQIDCPEGEMHQVLAVTFCGWVFSGFISVWLQLFDGIRCWHGLAFSNSIVFLSSYNINVSDKS